MEAKEEAAEGGKEETERGDSFSSLSAAEESLH